MPKRLPLALIVLLFVPQPSRAVTWLVSTECPTIQAGIDSAGYGDTVLVEPGTYYEHDIIMKNGVTLLGQMGPEATVIDAQQLGRVIYCEDVDSTTTIEGLTITGGNAPNSPWGGGICCKHASPRILGNDISENSAGAGGGIVCLDYSSPRIEGNTITHNLAGMAGGIGCEYSAPVIVSNVIAHNTANWDGGGIAFDEATIVSDNIITHNTADMPDGYGGGIFCMGAGSLVTGNSITFNSAGYGGGIHTEWNGTFTGNTISHNYAMWGGGVFIYYTSSPVLEGNIISFNGLNGLACYPGSPASVTCCNFYNDVNFYECDDVIGINGNFSEDPLFCDAGAEDFHLDCSSPCVHGYGCGRIGAWGVGCGSTRVEPTTWSALKALYR